MLEESTSSVLWYSVINLDTCFYCLKTKLCYIISDIDKALAFEWVADKLHEKNYDIYFILLNPKVSDFEYYLKAHNLPVTRVICRGKKDWASGIAEVSKLLSRLDPQIVHCHLLQAGIIGLTAAKLSGIRHRIYTRHHSTQHHVYNPKGIWLDRYCNWMATRIVAVSGLVKRILIDWEKVPSSKIELIPHGFSLEHFYRVDSDRVDAFRARHQIHADYPIIGVISRFIELKGIQYIIPAFGHFLDKFPDAVLILLNARGDFELEIRKELSHWPECSYRCIVFDSDISAAYGAMDIFIHVPVDDHSEAFGQTYVEALAAGIPSIFTLSGIAPDFIKDGENAIVVPYRNSDAIYTALMRLTNYPDLKLRLAKSGPASVIDKFDLPVMINALDNLYKQCLNP